MNKTKIKELWMYSEKRIIKALIHSEYGDFYVFDYTEKNGKTTFNAIGPTSNNAYIYTNLVFEDDLEIIKDNEWIGRRAEDLILFKEEEKLIQDMRTHQYHQENKEDIFNDPFIYVV